MLSTNNNLKTRAWYEKQPTSKSLVDHLQKEMSKFQHHAPNHQKAKLTEFITHAVIDKQRHSVSQKSFKDSLESIADSIQKKPPSSFKSMALMVIAELQKDQKTTLPTDSPQPPAPLQRGFINTVFNRLESKPMLAAPIQTLATLFQNKTSEKELFAAVKDYLNPDNHDGIPPSIRIQLFNKFINSQATTTEAYPLMERKLTFANMALTYLESIGSKSLPTPAMFGLVHGETARYRKPENEGGKAIVQTSVGELSTIPDSKLGAGAFGVTKQAIAQGMDYVIKKIPLSQSGWSKNYHDFFAATKEASIGKHLSGHPNIAQTLDMYVYDDAKTTPGQKNETASTFVIVMAPGLKNGEAVLRDPDMSATKKIQFLLDVAKGLEHIHHAGFVHNDVKADNFLLFDGDIGKVSDFGCAGRIGETDYHGDTLEISVDIQKFIALIRENVPAILRTELGKDWYAVYKPVESLSRDAVPHNMAPIIELLEKIMTERFRGTSSV
jgi:hypothetical protein